MSMIEKAESLGADRLPEEALKTLHEVTCRVIAVTKPEKVLGSILRDAVLFLRADRGMIFFPRDEGKKELAPVLAATQPETTDSSHSGTVVAQVFESGVPLFSWEPEGESTLDQSQSAQQLKIASVLCVPLFLREELKGVLYVDCRGKPRSFTPSEVGFLEAFANIAAIAIDNAQHLDLLAEENTNLQREIARQKKFGRIVGPSSAMQEVFQLIRKAADVEAKVLIRGESGTGKELVAREIHERSRRRDSRFLAVNCAALSETLLESELFGHRKGSFTGASTDRRGIFEESSGGTVFLDEIGEMSPGMQSKLLRVLQEGEICRVGETTPTKVDVRVIAATHRDLESRIKESLFREDLYYRIRVISIQLPPLRSRREDVPALFQHFAKGIAAESNLEIPELAPEAWKALDRYSWPGNVRELENEVIRLLAMVDPGDRVKVGDLSDHIREAVAAPITGGAPSNLKEAVQSVEIDMIKRFLKDCGGNKKKTAEQLGISREGLRQKLMQYDID